MVLGDTAISFMPQKSWKFDAKTKKVPVNGWHQGATLIYGAGRIVVFGEAAMFTSQLSNQTNGKKKAEMGLTVKGAEQNEYFLINIMLWLSKKI